MGSSRSSRGCRVACATLRHAVVGQYIHQRTVEHVSPHRRTALRLVGWSRLRPGVQPPPSVSSSRGCVPNPGSPGNFSCARARVGCTRPGRTRRPHAAPLHRNIASTREHVPSLKDRLLSLHFFEFWLHRSDEELRQLVGRVMMVQVTDGRAGTCSTDERSRIGLGGLHAARFCRTLDPR